jgi:hypothetical protein
MGFEPGVIMQHLVEAGIGGACRGIETVAADRPLREWM